MWVYNNDGKVIPESDGSGSITSDYVWGPDRLLVKKDKTSNKDYYYLYNGHGDVVQIVDTNGNIVNSYDYDAWGNILNQTEGIDNSFKYAGEIYDKETGLYYLRARYYDSQVGRLINEDTVEGTVTDPLSLNWYTYCEDNPVDNVDPSGHFAMAAALPFAYEVPGVGEVLAAGTVVVATGYGVYKFGEWVGDKVNKHKNEGIDANISTKHKYKTNDKTPGGWVFTEHGAQRANERGFTAKNIDDIITHGKKTKSKVDEYGRKTREYTDARGNKVVVNEKGGIVSVHSNTKTGKYIPKPKNKNKNKNKKR